MNDDAHHLRPSEAARLLGVSTEAVLHWIAAGQLRALDLSFRAGERPRWRIAMPDLDAFLSSRVKRPVAAPVRRKHGRPRTNPVREYY